MKKELHQYSDKEIFLLVAGSTFVPFSHHDYESFSGVTSQDPMICYRIDLESDLILIIDDGKLVLVDPEMTDEIELSLVASYRF